MADQGTNYQPKNAMAATDTNASLITTKTTTTRNDIQENGGANTGNTNNNNDLKQDQRKGTYGKGLITERYDLKV